MRLRIKTSKLNILLSWNVSTEIHNLIKSNGAFHLVACQRRLVSSCYRFQRARKGSRRTWIKHQNVTFMSTMISAWSGWTMKTRLPWSHAASRHPTTTFVTMWKNQLQGKKKHLQILTVCRGKRKATPNKPLAENPWRRRGGQSKTPSSVKRQP